MRSSVGLRWVTLVDQPRQRSVRVAVFFPTAAPERQERLGPFTLSVALEAEPLDGPWPLVLLSHGSGGSALSHRELACHLASRGFVVGVPEHPFNNRTDDTLAQHPELVRFRTEDLRLVADWFLRDGPLASRVRPGAYSNHRSLDWRGDRPRAGRRRPSVTAAPVG